MTWPMRLLLSTLFLITYTLLPAQLRESDVCLLNDVLFQKINALRTDHKLQPLVQDSMLMQAAAFHSAYMTRYGKLSHKQASRKTKTPKNRVDRFSDEFEMVGENILFLLEKKKRLKPDRIEQLADEMFLMWKNSPGHYANMIHPDFEYGGLGFARSKSGKLYATNVFGKKGIKIPGQLSKNAFRVKPPAKHCHEWLKDKENLVVNMGNSVEVLGDEVAFYHHNLEVLQEVLSGSKDGMAVDLVTSDQFCCGQENHLDMSEIYDGVMLKPVYKAQLLAENKAQGNYRLVAHLGKVPETMQGKRVKANLILIKNGRRCAYTVPQYIPRADYQLIPTPPRIYQPANVRLITHGIIGTEEIQFDFNRGITTPSFTSVPQKKSGAIALLEIFSNSSIEGDAENNELLHQERARYIQNFVERYTRQDSITVRTHAKENWEAFNYQVELHGLSKLKSKTKEEIRRWVVSDTTVNWDSLLYVQRRSYACIHYRGRWKSNDPRHAERNLRSALLQKNYEWANKALAQMCTEEAKNSFILDESLLKHFLTIPQLVQNTSALLSISSYSDLEVRVRFLRQWIKQSADLSPDAIFNLLILYNHTVYELLDRWDVRASILAKVVHPSKVKQLMQQLGANSEEMLLNYHLASIKYFGQTNEGEYINASFDFITNYFRDRALDLDDEIMLCLFFNLWSRYDLTTQFLFKRIDAPEFNEQAAFILARTAMAYPEPFTEEQLFTILQKAYDYNPIQWCLWIKRSFQALRYPLVKEMYCEECEKWVNEPSKSLDEYPIIEE